MTTLYVKKGHRYQPWGHLEQDWHRDGDLMPIGAFRLVHCPAPGHYRTTHDVTPDTAAFLAAAEVAAVAMEEAIRESAAHRPGTTVQMTPQQQEILQRYRREMAAAGGSLPIWWQNSSAREIAQAGIDAVREAAGHG